MIRAVLLYSGGRCVGFDCNGHAGHNVAGKDIVCSAVSALTTATVNGIVEVAKVQAGVSVDEDDGIHLILAKDTGSDELDRAELLLKTLELGLRSIQEAYPRNLKVTIKEV